ncbi:MAG: hypothetical protein IIA72_18435 [Proteobacteria bacterium]|nr:hypothetical protein [Pseudomonadota bacterium]
MTEPLKRDEVVGLLERLGSEPDEEVLEAARQVHARITAAGMTWDDLLVPDQADSVTDDSDDTGDTDDIGDTDDAEDTEDSDEIGDTDDAGHEDLDDETAEPAAEAAGKNAESLTLIDKLLAKSGISQDLREELKGYKADIAEGDFGDGDRRYLRAINARLSKRR